jgi:hypothetical protein
MQTTNKWKEEMESEQHRQEQARPQLEILIEKEEKLKAESALKTRAIINEVFSVQNVYRIFQKVCKRTNDMRLLKKEPHLNFNASNIFYDLEKEDITLSEPLCCLTSTGF